MYVLKNLKPVYLGMKTLRTLYTSLFILLLTASTVSGFGIGSSTSQIQEAGVKINNESLPPQLALNFSIHNTGSGETENIQSRRSNSEESSEPDFSFDDRKGYTLYNSKHEDYKRDSVKIVPGLQIKDLIFPFHSHT